MSLQVSRVPLADLRPDGRNPRQHPDQNLAAIKASLQRFGQAEPLVVNSRSGLLVGGHGRLAAMRALGWPAADVVHVDLDDAQALALSLALNRTGDLATYDEAALLQLLLAMPRELQGDAGFDQAAMLELMRAAAGQATGPEFGALAARFGVPPFSVLDARQGYWQERRRAWLSLGLRSELGRGEGGRRDYAPGDAARAATLGAIPSNERTLKDQRGPYKRPTRRAGAQK
jgi:hypothetical protein